MTRRLFVLLAVVLSVTACDKKNLPEPQGGDIPTNYVAIRAGSITPYVLKVKMGSSITFLNQDAVPHSILSNDTTTIRSGLIAPRSSYFFKKDTLGTFPYLCVDDSSLTGIIIIE